MTETEFKNITVPLGKGHKLIERIKEHINYHKPSRFCKKYSDKESDIYFVKVKFEGQGTASFLDQLKQAKLERNQTFDLYFSLNTDYEEMREAIFRGNLETSLSKKLHQIEVLKERQKFLQKAILMIEKTAYVKNVPEYYQINE